MRSITDRKYLKEQQYKTADNLQARINLHARFSTSTYPWFSWVYDHLDLQPGMRVLEAGCGPGSLWAHNHARLPVDLRLFLGDLSAGMVTEARQSNQHPSIFRFLCLDAQHIPFPDGSFDVVIANHMLYHVPDLPQAVRELARVLRPDGRLIAATNGDRHMRELHDLVHAFDPAYRPTYELARRFSLENAARVLSEAFDPVQVHIYEDSLEVTEVEPLVAYVYSMFSHISDLSSDRIAAFEIHVRDHMKDGVFHISKSQGLVTAWPRLPAAARQHKVE